MGTLHPSPWVCTGNTPITTPPQPQPQGPESPRPQSPSTPHPEPAPGEAGPVGAHAQACNTRLSAQGPAPRSTGRRPQRGLSSGLWLGREGGREGVRAEAPGEAPRGRRWPRGCPGPTSQGPETAGQAEPWGLWARLLGTHACARRACWPCPPRSGSWQPRPGRPQTPRPRSRQSSCTPWRSSPPCSSGAPRPLAQGSLHHGGRTGGVPGLPRQGVLWAPRGPPGVAEGRWGARRSSGWQGEEGLMRSVLQGPGEGDAQQGRGPRGPGPGPPVGSQPGAPATASAAAHPGQRGAAGRRMPDLHRYPFQRHPRCGPLSQRHPRRGPP